MRIHNIYRDLLSSITYLFDGNLLDSDTIKKYEFNIGNRSFQIEYDTKFKLPAALINFVDARPFFGVAPFAYKSLNVPNTNKLIALKNNTLESELLLQTQYYEVGIDIIINCESQYHALEIQQRLINKLPLGKPLEVYQFISYLEIDDVFLAELMFDVDNHEIDNLYSRFNYTTSKDEYSFAVTYTPRVKMDSCQASIQTTAAHSWSVNCNFQFYLPWPILLEFQTKQGSIYGAGVGPSTSHEDTGAQYTITTPKFEDQIYPLPPMPFISVDQTVEPTVEESTQEIGDAVGRLRANNLIIPCNDYEILYLDITNNNDTIRLGRPFSEVTHFDEFQGFDVTSNILDRKISTIGTLNYNYQDYTITKLNITKRESGLVTATLESDYVNGVLQKSELDEINETIIGKFIGTVEIDSTIVNIDEVVAIDYQPQVQFQEFEVEDISDIVISNLFTYTDPKLSNITNDVRLLIDNFYPGTLPIDPHQTKILGIQLKELANEFFINIDVSDNNIVLDNEYRFSFNGSFNNYAGNIINYVIYGVLDQQTYEWKHTLDIINGSSEDYDVTFFTVDLIFHEITRFTKHNVNDIVISLSSDDYYISSNINFANKIDLLTVSSKLKFDTNDIFSAGGTTTIVFRYDKTSFFYDIWEMHINSNVYTENNITLSNKTKDTIEFELSDELYGTFNISQSNPLVLRFYKNV
jgi:hypothetical protein